MYTPSFTFTEAERRLFARREVLLGADWASRHLIVQDGLYAGSPLRLDVSPFLAGPLNMFTLPGVQEVIVCGSLQVGKTLFLYSCLGWCMDYRPGVKMLAMPTKQALEKVVKRKLLPLLKGSPTLRRLVEKYRTVTILLKDGTAIELASAETPSDRASITVQDLIIDEEDLYSGSGQSNPLEDFKGRTRSYEDYAKIARACQIKGGEESSIWRGITQEAEMLFCYEALCPACRRRVFMRVDNIVIPCGEKDLKVIRSRRLARYRCECNYHWSDHIRDLAVSGGDWHPYRYTADAGFERLEGPGLSDLLRRWRAGSEEPPKSAGFHMPAVLSRFVSLSHIAARRITAEASEDPVAKRQYFNDDLALPYTPVELVTDAAKILERRADWLPPLHIPHGAVAITGGVDVQKRGFWYLFKAWMPNMSSYIINYGQIATNDPLQDWVDLQKLVFDTYYPVLIPGGFPGWNPQTAVLPPESLTGELLPVWRAPMDSGGTETEGVYTRTEEVYMWVRANGGGVVHACKGASRAQITPVRRTIRERMPHNGRPIPGGLPLYLLDTNAIKTLALSRLLNPDSSQPCLLHAGCDQDLAEQLASEQQVRKNGRLVWERKGGLNHLLDCLMLADAAADASWTPSLPMYVLQLQQQERAANMAQGAKPKKRDHGVGPNGRGRDAYTRTDRSGRSGRRRG